jgi:hypothetical protein
MDGNFFIVNPSMGNLVADYDYFKISWLHKNGKGILIIF